MPVMPVRIAFDPPLFRDNKRQQVEKRCRGGASAPEQQGRLRTRHRVRVPPTPRSALNFAQEAKQSTWLSPRG
jgi:hypothetical protein